MSNKEKKELFLEYAKHIKGLGYRVIITNREYSYYGWIVNEKDQIGYFQLSSWGFGIQLSMIHKPCKNFASGFTCMKDHFDYYTEKELTKENIDRCFSLAPEWATGNLSEIRKWSAEEYLSKHWGKEYDVEI